MVTQISCNSDFVAALCEDGNLCLLNSQLEGMELFNFPPNKDAPSDGTGPAAKLTDVPLQVACTESCVLVLTNNGKVFKYVNCLHFGT